MLATLICYIVALLRFRDYEPQPISFATIKNWIKQFESISWRDLFSLLWNIEYVTAKQTKHTLSGLNRDLLKRLKEDGVTARRVIYVSVSDAGSSSPAMLAMLRNFDRRRRMADPQLDCAVPQPLLQPELQSRGQSGGGDAPARSAG